MICDPNTPTILQPILRAYKENRLKRAEEFYGTQISRFHPILANPKVYQNFNIDQIQPLLESRSGIITSKQALGLRNRIYTDAKLVESIKEDIYQINADLFSRKPHSIAEFNHAFDLIEKSTPWLPKLFNMLCIEICPIKFTKVSSDRFWGGFTSYDLFGAIFVSITPAPFPALNLAISLVHELGHLSLHLLMAGQNPIGKASYSDWIYSGVRKTKRPALMSIHAAAALGYMISFCDATIRKKIVEEDELLYLSGKLKEYRKNLTDGLEALSTINLSPLGASVVSDLGRLI